MRITVGNISSTVTHATEKELSWLFNFLVMPEDTWAGRYAQSTMSTLFELGSQTFPTGLLGLVKKGCKQFGHHLTITDARARPCQIDVTKHALWLRDYQHEALEDLIFTEFNNGILQSPTGSGKTEVGIALTVKLPCNWLMIVHSADLAKQWADRFTLRTGEECGYWTAGQYKECRVMVATWHTVAAAISKRDPRAARRLERIQGLQVDECHRAGGSGFYNVLKNIPAYFRYGYSADPMSRSDKKGLLVIAATGEVVSKIGMDTLVEEGMIAKPTIKMVPYQTPPKLAELIQGTVMGWGDASARASTDEARIRFLAMVCAKAERPSMVFVRAVESGKALERLLQGAGVKAQFCFGESGKKIREASIKKMNDGQTEVLISNIIFREGIDLPAVKSVVLTEGGKSAIDVIQSLGRGTRKNAIDGTFIKSAFTVYDVADQHCGCMNVAANTFSHRICKWMTEHSAKRKRIYRVNKIEVLE